MKTTFLALLPVLLALLVGAPPALAWTWPLDGPVLQPFRFDGDPYAAGHHRGIDVAGDLGQHVRAPASGSVSFAGTVPGGGRTVTIRTADGYAVTLLHLGAVTVRRGGSVAEGAPVGTVGVSGTPEHDRPYVHLGVRVASDPEGYVDPLGLLPARVGAPPAGEPAPASPAEPAPETEAPPVEEPAANPPTVAEPAPPSPAPAVPATSATPAESISDRGAASTSSGERRGTVSTGLEVRRPREENAGAPQDVTRSRTRPVGHRAGASSADPVAEARAIREPEPVISDAARDGAALVPERERSGPYTLLAIAGAALLAGVLGGVVRSRGRSLKEASGEPLEEPVVSLALPEPEPGTVFLSSGVKPAECSVVADWPSLDRGVRRRHPARPARRHTRRPRRRTHAGATL